MNQRPDAMDPDNDLDHDSTFGGDRASLASSTTSLTESATRWQFEHGRRYHGYRAGKYYFPNDESELNRMDLEHTNQLLQMDQKLHLCPLEEPKEILDLGCGTGIWCIDMADLYPECQVTGTDLSPVQPTWVPPNCSFVVDDFEQEWTFGSNRFDMIHGRFLMGSISSHADLYKEVLNALKPGGWFEVVDMESSVYSDDGSVTPDCATTAWARNMDEAFDKIGKPIPKVEKFAEFFENAGFVSVESKVMKRPTNDWPKDPLMKEIGRYTCLNYLEGLEGFTMAPFTRILGWRPEEVQVLISKVRKETVSRRIHGWQKGIIVIGQKPHL